MTLEPMPETWTRALAVVAHPDDLEYGAASAIARWTADGRSVAYVIVTDGEAGIDAIPPAEAAVLRQKEQLFSAAVVGVDDVSFLHHRDGVVEYGLALRRDLTRHIRRVRHPAHRLPRTDSRHGRRAAIPHQADHRAVGLAVLDAARDAGNRWIFPELLDEDSQPWAGVTDVYLTGADQPNHGVEVTGTISAGVDSLRAHRAYLDGLGRDFDPEQFLRAVTADAGRALGAEHAIAIERIRLQGV